MQHRSGREGYLASNGGVVRAHHNEVRRHIESLRLNVHAGSRDADKGGSHIHSLHV